MEIKILGVGCAKCVALEKRVKEAVGEMGISAEIKKITDLGKILEYNVVMTPALVVNGNVICYGRVPNKEEIKNWLKK